MKSNITTVTGTHAHGVIWGVLLAVFYLISGKLGLMLALPPGYTSPIFPPAGIAIAAALIAGRKSLPWIFIGSLLLNVWVDYSSSQQLNATGMLAASAIALASLMQAGLGGWALQRAIGYPVVLDQGRDILRLLSLIPIICLTSATVSISALWAIGSIGDENIAVNWLSWWAGDTLGVVVMLPIVLTLFGEPTEIWRSRRLTVAAPMLLVFALFIVVFLKANRWEYENSLSGFREYTQQAFNQVHNKLDEQVVLLDGLTELFLHDKKGAVSREEFHRFVQKTLQHFPMIQALEWAPKVEASQRKKFEAAQRVYFPQFQIRERDEQNILVHANERAAYYPVTYVEPEKGNEASAGFDLASSIARREAVAKTIQIGEVVTTKALQLVQDNQHQAGILILSAISPQNNQSGVVLTVLKMDDFMNALLTETRTMLYIRLTDLDDNKVLYDNFKQDSAQELGEYSFVFGTRHYRLASAPTPLYLKQHRGWQSIAVLTAGLVGIGLMTMLLLLGTGYTARIAKEVKDKTKKLAESETILGYILNTSPIAVRVATRRGRQVVFCNARYEDLVKNHEAIGDDPQKYYAHPEQYDSLLLELEHGGKVLNREVELNIPGSPNVFALCSYLLMQYQGEDAVLGWFYDITAQKNTERAYRMESEKTLALLHNASDGIHILDHDGNLVEASDSFCAMLGYTREELIGKNVMQWDAHFSAEELPTVLAKQINSRTRSEFETRHRRKDGSVFDVEVSGISFELDGQYLLFNSSRDITAQKLAQHELLQQKQFAEDIINSLPGVFYVLDQQGKFLRVNARFLSVSGYTQSEFDNMTALELFEGEDEHTIALRIGEVFTTGSAWAEAKLLSKSGQKTPYFFSGQKMMINGLPYLVGLGTDITERQQTLEKLRATASDLERANAQIEIERAHLSERVDQRTAQLRYANHAKDSFLATMSHEIRTPLGGLLGMMELLDLSHLDQSQHEMLSAAMNSGKSLLRIVNDILDWSKIEAGKLELSPRATSIPQVLKDVFATYTQLANDKDLQLKLNIDTSLSNEMHRCDALRLSQILNNFTSNAIKFTDHGSVEIGVERLVRQEDGDLLRFIVRDSGVGIAKKNLPRLFQHYEQGSADTARMYGGTGLGLSICHRLAELMGGTLSVKSEQGVGSTFSFTICLPVEECATPRIKSSESMAKEVAKDERSIAALATDGQRISILIVDDHPLNRLLLKQQLELLGLHIVAAADGVQALAMFEQQPPDLIITDCHMPEMDGYEFTRCIRDIERIAGAPRVPIIAWTANVLAEESERCFAAGMDDMLTKPTELPELRAMLLKWLISSKVLTTTGHIAPDKS